MNKKELEKRTKKFAVNVVNFVSGFRASDAGRVIGRQLLKSGTSIGANYREANRAVSRRDFAHRITIVEKEASETVYWLEICAETELGDKNACGGLSEEAVELLAIFTAIGRSLKANERESKLPNKPGVSETESADYGMQEIEINLESFLPNTVE
jgi:four helix bundle protein